MCLGGQPKAPTVVYQGPSDADIKRQQDGLDAYRETMKADQAAFQSGLQAQIDKGNEETAALQAQFDDELADLTQANDDASAKTAAGYASESSSAAALASAEMASYSTSAKQTEMPEGAQTTAAVTNKKKPKKNLKISTAGTASKAGSGLNIGV